MSCTPSQAFANLIDALNEGGAHLDGNYAQLACLVADALSIINPENDKAAADAERLCLSLGIVSEIYDLPAEYEDED